MIFLTITDIVIVQIYPIGDKLLVLVTLIWHQTAITRSRLVLTPPSFPPPPPSNGLPLYSIQRIESKKVVPLQEATTRLKTLHTTTLEIVENTRYKKIGFALLRTNNFEYVRKPASLFRVWDLKKNFRAERSGEHKSRFEISSQGERGKKESHRFICSVLFLPFPSSSSFPHTDKPARCRAKRERKRQFPLFFFFLFPRLFVIDQSEDYDYFFTVY